MRMPVEKDDIFYIPAGMVHAIGEGVLVAEIQENSNLTYRLYDYDCVGKNGKRRHSFPILKVAVYSSRRNPQQGCMEEQSSLT